MTAMAHDITQVITNTSLPAAISRIFVINPAIGPFKYGASPRIHPR